MRKSIRVGGCVFKWCQQAGGLWWENWVISEYIGVWEHTYYVSSSTADSGVSITVRGKNEKAARETLNKILLGEWREV